MDFEKTAISTYPTVWAVGDEYQIFVPVSKPTLMWVEVGGENYYDHSNGIMRSDTIIHKMTVPKESLDKACKYKICYREMIERKPYFPVTGEIESFEFNFRPVKSGDLNIYHIADAHNRVEGPAKAAEFFGDDLDFLILNGDIPEDSRSIENISTVYKLAGAVTKGEIPAVFSRGNHDTRGFCAEQFANYTPNSNGVSYYTVRLGDIWCLVLDTAEDKSDESIEYGNTICCHSYRLSETKFLENVIKNAKNEYKAKGVKKKIVISHTPFTRKYKEPFNIEEDLYSYWVELISKKIKPDFYLSGHTHTCEVNRPGSEEDAYGQSCPTVIASKIDYDDYSKYKGCAISYKNNKPTIFFTNEKKEVEDTIEL